MDSDMIGAVGWTKSRMKEDIVLQPERTLRLTQRKTLEKRASERERRAREKAFQFPIFSLISPFNSRALNVTYGCHSKFPFAYKLTTLSPHAYSPPSHYPALQTGYPAPSWG